MLFVQLFFFFALAEKQQDHKIDALSTPSLLTAVMCKEVGKLALLGQKIFPISGSRHTEVIAFSQSSGQRTGLRLTVYF